MSSNITVRELTTEEHERWDRFVALAPGGSIYAMARYLEVLCPVTDATFRVVAGFRGDDLVGGVALYERRNTAGVYVRPRLLLYYNGLVLAAPSSRYPSEAASLRIKLMVALDDWLSRQRYAHVCLKSRGDLTDVRPFLARGWTVEPAYTYEVGLGEPEAAYGRIERNFRRLIRRCEKEGVELVADGDFDTFFELHRAIHERKSAPIYLPRDRYRAYCEELRAKGLGRIYHVHAPDGKAAATQLVLLGPHPVCHTVCAGATSEHLNSGASVFLRWKVMEALMAEGYQGNDLTDAALNKVTRFKSQLGGELRLSLAVTRPSSLRWRALRQANAPRRFARRAVRYAARRLRRR